MLIELPCGILHNDVVFDRVVVKELTGRQQNYLINMELVANNLGHIPKLLEDLTFQFQTAEGRPLELPVKEAIWQLSSEDVEFILLKIREETYGSVLALPVTCPHCSKSQLKKVDLDKLDVIKLKDKKVRTKLVELPKSKQTAEVKLLYLKDLFDLYKALREKQTTLYTSSLALSVQKLGDKSPINEEDLMNLPVKDLQLIEKAFGDLRSSVDTLITNECEGCQKEFDVALPVMDPSFFVQPQTPTT